jgi:hypothetical protein
MTTKTWEAEFMPTPATEPKTVIDAVRHSLRKWIGFRLENLQRHDVRIDAEFFNLHCRDTTCALCQQVNSDCARCPLREFLGH